MQSKKVSAPVLPVRFLCLITALGRWKNYFVKHVVVVVQYLYIVGMIKLPQYFSLSLFRCALERVVFKGLEDLDEVVSPHLAANHLFLKLKRWRSRDSSKGRKSDHLRTSAGRSIIQNYQRLIFCKILNSIFGVSFLNCSLQVNGVRASYNLSGRRLEGELSFAYTTLTYRARLTQVCNGSEL